MTTASLILVVLCTFVIGLFLGVAAVFILGYIITQTHDYRLHQERLDDEESMVVRLAEQFLEEQGERPA